MRGRTALSPPGPGSAMNALFWLMLCLFLLVAGVSLEVARGWRHIRQLKDQPEISGATAPRVSIIVSALNEADTIAPALRSLLSIAYAHLEVIVIDDRSTDATPQILARIAAEHPALRTLQITTLPAGWLGKNHALHCGAGLATGDYLLFTDADAVFAPDAVSRAVAYCEAHATDHLALLFDVVAHSPLLRMMIVSFVGSFMARFKPWKVNRSGRHSIGVGGFNLVRRSAYRRIGGHAALPLAVLDDLVLGERLNAGGYRQQVLFGSDMVRIEWYPDTPALVRGMEKNIFAAFDYRVSQLLLVTFLMLATRVWPWVGLCVTQGPIRWLCAATAGAGLALSVDLLVARKWSLWCLVLAPAVPLLELMIWWRGCLLTLWRGGIAWRGTFYRLADIRRAHRTATRAAGEV